jgi:hypothetical protein
MKVLFMVKDIVKTRERQGTSSLDLTLPTNIKKRHNIKSGDVFKVDSFKENGELKIIYTLIYKND